MNLWIVNQYAVPPSQAGITRHHNLARGLINRGHRVSIIASSFDHVTRQETRLPPGVPAMREEADGVPFLWLRTPPYRGNSWARVRNMLSFASQVGSPQVLGALPPPDAIIGSSPHLFGALAAQRLARRLGVPFILEVRDLWPQSLIDLGNVSPRHPLVGALGAIERHLYREAAAIVSLLPQAASHMVERGARAERILWLPNGVDLGQVPAPRPAPGGERLRVIYAGSHGLANGLDSLVEAAAMLERAGFADRIELRFIGDGPEKPRLMAKAQAAGLTLLHFDDPVPKRGIYPVLQQADAFVATMRDVALYRHGISFNKLYDYMALARPTLFGTTGVATPIAEADAGLLVPAEDAAALAEGLQRLVALDPQARWQLGMNGRAYVERHCDVRKHAERLEALVAEAVGLPVAA